jgi:oligosaccharyltransferase complex subunit alpha (ribophorin I)
MNSTRCTPKMKLLILFTLFAAIFASSSVSTVPINVKQNFVNTNVNRIVDLTQPSISRETIVLTVKNVGSGVAKEYVVALDQTVADVSLAYMQLRVKNKDKLGESLHVTAGSSDSKSSVQLYSVPVNLPSGETMQLQINLVFVGMTNNLPKEVNQNDRGSVTFDGNLYFDSPYPSEKQKLTVKYVYH